jgi:hypothetical protein
MNSLQFEDRRQKLVAIPADFDNPLSRAASTEHEGVTFKIEDHFAVYLAQTNSQELLEYLRSKAKEIRLFISAIESRVTPKP